MTRPEPTTFNEAVTDYRRAWIILAKPFVRALERLCRRIARWL